jgi:(p)ppGpp synthase/HD superfamily hydrolase
MALNKDPEIRRWVEEWLKNKERSIAVSMTDEEFEKHWLYVRPERMHEGAIEGVAAYGEFKSGD